MTSEQLTDKIVNLIFEKKGIDVKVIELKAVSTVADYFVICSADSDTHVKAITEHVQGELKDEGIRVWHREGMQVLKWVLLDYVDVVVHIFLKDARSYYNLERLWGDAPVKELQDPLFKDADNS